MAPKKMEGYVTVADPEESDVESEATNTSSEAEDTEEETKSVDFQEKEKKDDDDDDDVPDPNASSSSGTETLLPNVVVVANKSTDEETFADAEVLLVMEEASSKADYQKLHSYLEKRVMFYGKKMIDIKKTIKKMETEETKQKKKEEKSIKDAEKKEQKAKKKDITFVLNINFAGQTFPINVSRGMTLQDIRPIIGDHLKMTKKVSKSLSVRIADTDWTSGRKTVGGMMKEKLLKEGDTLIVSTGLRGGGPKRKTTSTDDNVIVLIAPTVLSSDPDCIRQALQLKGLNIEPWVKGLSKQKLKDFMDTLDSQPKTGNLPSLIAPYLSFITEWSNLKDRFLGTKAIFTILCFCIII